MSNKRFLACLLLTFFTLAMATNFTFSQSANLVATIATDKYSYVLRETVEIYGNVTYNGNPVDQGLVGIQIADPLSNIIIRTVPTGTGQTQPSDIEFGSFYLSDSEGNPKTEFERGEKAYFWVQVKNTGEIISRNVLVTINLFDSTSIPLGFDYIKTTINPKGSLVWVSAITIAKWASIGNTQAYASVLTDWPRNNGYPYLPEKATNFTIIESQYEEPPNNTIPQQPIENGTYTTNFRLSPEPRPGIYTASVCAWYQGYSSQAATTFFQVENITAPPRASFIIKPPIADINYTVTFDGSFSSAEGYNDTITSYVWDFGDGQNSTGKTVTHKYANFGNYTVTLNVTDSGGLWNTTSKSILITEIHDIALTSIQCLDEIYSDWLVTITIDVENKGTFVETFNVTAYFNTSIIATTTVNNLDPLEQTTLNFQWNTTGLPLYVSYTITAAADILPNETETTDNNITYGTTKTKALGDIDGDRDVDIFDIVWLASAYGTTSGGSKWDIQLDLKRDDQIDIFDVVIAASRYGTNY